MTVPSVTFLCPSCGGRVEAADLRPACPGCGARIDLRPGNGFPGEGPLGACSVCGSEALHLAKDFNRNLGVAIVALGALGFLWGAATGIATLVVLTVADRVVYRLRPQVTVCYACKSVYRGLRPNPAHRAYELTFDETFEGTGEKPAFHPPERDRGGDATGQSPR